MTQNPLWWRDGIIYQIYPRSFADSNGDGIGDLPGIIQKLDYIAELGVDAIWLSPIYPSPNVDFGYDVSNYIDVDPIYGTLADFDRLAAEAHRRNIHIVLDLVLNHTSDQHPWFQAAKRSHTDPYHDWYLWRDPASDGGVPNNWQSTFGGKGWEFVPEVGQYYFHMFAKEQPDVNWRNPALRQAMLDVFRFWLDRGADGFRLDVFNVYFKDAQFRNNPPKPGIRPFDQQEHLYDCDQQEMFPLLTEIRALLDEKPGRYAVGETFIHTPKKAASFCAPGLLPAAFDFELLESRWHPRRFLNAIQRWEAALQPGSWPNYVLNNHDNPRSATRYVRGENDDRLKVAATLLLTLRGTPFLYYGEEIGMRDIPMKRSEILDPVGKHYWPFFKGRDGCRAPMQWDNSIYAGFSPARSWLKVQADHDWRNVESQRADADSLFSFYRRLIQLRKEYPALREGMFLSLNDEPRRLLAYLRKTDEQTVLIALNFSRFPVKLVLGHSLAKSQMQLLLSNKRDVIVSPATGLLSLAGQEACIILLEN
ncbi:MAG: alpha-glucosidase [Anaerolineaceae bacterium]|jgi:alpha-glucosidase